MSTTTDDQQQDQQDDQQQQEDTGQGGNEAARYRRRLREAEGQRDAVTAERDGLAQRVERMQRADVERLASTGGLAAPADLWALGGVELAELLDDDGEVDAEAVAEAVAGVLEARPGLRGRRRPAPDRSQGSTHAQGGAKRVTTWGDALSRR